MAKRLRQIRREARRSEPAPAPARPPIDFRRYRIGLYILAATLIAYLPALNGTLLWDDDRHVTRAGLQSLEGLREIWFQLGATQQYYPLLHSAFWFEHAVWGDAVAGYHLINVLLHATASFLVVLIARRLSLAGAWLAGFLFALHPVCVEAVAWISEQKSTLSGVFYLGAVLAYLSFDETRRRSRYLLALGLFILALLSKTVTATLPAVLLAILWWKRGRLERTGRGGVLPENAISDADRVHYARPHEWRRDIRPLLAWFPIGAAAGLFTAWVERRFVGAEGSDYTLSLTQRILLAGRAIWFYAAKIVWPANLIFIYPRWNLNPGEWWQWLFPAGVLAVAIGLVLLARRFRGPLAGSLIFAGTLVPVLGFLNVYPFRYSWVADHFQYLAMLGLIVPAAAGFMSLTIPRKDAIAVVVLAVLGVLTWRQSGTYRNAQTLYRTTLERNPDAYMAHNNFGNFLLGEGRVQDAIGEFQAALRTEPNNSEAHDNLANALSQMPDRLPEAIAEYQAALRISPDDPEVHNNLGSALMNLPGRAADGIAEFQTAVRLRPWYVEAHVNLGNALLELPGHRADAVIEFETALQLQPGYPPALTALRRLRHR